MSEVGDALGAVAGLAFGALIILLMAPTLDSMTPVNLTGLGAIFLFGAVVLFIILVVTVVSELLQ